MFTVAGECVGTACTYCKECNKCNLTAIQWFWMAHHNNWSKWFVVSNPPCIRCPSLSFMGGVTKKSPRKKGCFLVVRTNGSTLVGGSRLGALKGHWARGGGIKRLKCYVSKSILSISTHQMNADLFIYLFDKHFLKLATKVCFLF
jgi:hypothetical protein